MQRILVIRGGAVGDMIVTLPALGGLRTAFPQAHIELLGHSDRALLAQHPHYVDQVTDLERWDVYRLFSPSPAVSNAFASYLRTWTAILSYLPSLDTTFVKNLQHYCGGEVRTWPPHPPSSRHITEHLLRPIGHFSSQTYDPCPHVYLDPGAQARAAHFWHTAGLPEHGVVAFHPGSGGTHKLWPLEGWCKITAWAAGMSIPGLLISGPAEQARLPQGGFLEGLPPWPCVQDLPLPELAAILARCEVVVGHDSGVTHLAAAVGTSVLAFFGPTDPYIWGPRSPRACVLWPEPSGTLTLKTLTPDMVIRTLHALLRESLPLTPSPVDCTILRF